MNAVQKGIEYLLRCQRDDGGIPSTDPSQPSGSWTTAHTLFVCLSSEQFPFTKEESLRAMVRFLLRARISGSGWPMARGSSAPSALPTGPAVAALSLAKALYPTGSSELDEIQTAIGDGIAWLTASQNDDGGWGLDSVTGRSESRVLTTCYALRGFVAVGLDVTRSQVVARATSYLQSLATDEGGLGTQRNVKPDVCSTARVIYALLATGAAHTNDPLMIRLLGFLQRRRAEWSITTEKYNAPGAPGMVTYHGNTLYDVLLALIALGNRGRDTRGLVDFLLRSQDESGCWYFRDEKTVDTSISTWPTSEAVEALERAHELVSPFDTVPRTIRRQLLVYRLLLVLIVAVLILRFLPFRSLFAGAAQWWHALPDKLRDFLVVGVLAGVVAIFIAAFISKSGKRLKAMIITALRGIPKLWQ